MESCWRTEPHRRALLGDILAQLHDILHQLTDDDMVIQPLEGDEDDLGNNMTSLEEDGL